MKRLKNFFELLTFKKDINLIVMPLTTNFY